MHRIFSWLALGWMTWLCAVVLCDGRWAYGSMTPEAEEIYQKRSGAVLQVRVIERGTNQKSSIGSGFVFSKDGLVATNYHVISDAVNIPSQFYVEYSFPDGQRGELQVMNLDPVRDLAILKLAISHPDVLELGQSHMDKGEKIFSLGNPMDMGLIVADGLFNGLLEHSRYPKILFSGSLNPGMSGGPALDKDGRVIGVNVSTMGNQISFFVPVEYLKAMHQELIDNQGQSLGPEWKNIIRKRLVLESHEVMANIFNYDWEKTALGGIIVSGRMSDLFRCWGQSGDSADYWVVGTYLRCATEQNIYLSSTLTTGKIEIFYDWYQARDYNPWRFYDIFQGYEVYGREDFHEESHERDFKNFECRSYFVNVDGFPIKAQYCAREYKNYSGLFDQTLKLTSTHLWNSGLHLHLILNGVTEMQGKSFILKFLKELKWQR